MIECVCNGKYRIPALAVDVIIEEKRRIVLVKRKNEPFEGMWALPGGFVREGEETKKAAEREVKEETNLKVNEKELVDVFSDPSRDPRGHVVSITYFAKEVKGNLYPSSDAEEVKFFELNDLPNLAFDHNKIIKYYINEVKK